ncbi:hypothetical protein I4U23_015375 [Adineta vaga]|nr:hypothetical protein I4U23_015375 [Adineta vaga]
MGPSGTNVARITTVDETRTMFKMLRANGYIELDTVRIYNDGKQEAFTRETGVLNEGFTIATKVYPVEAGMHKPEKLRETFEISLRELGQPSVEIFYLHAPDRSVPFEETLEEVNKLYEEEKHGLTLIETAFRWLVHHSKLRTFDGDGIVIGASSVEQLESNLKDLQKGPLPEGVVQTLDEAWRMTHVIAKAYWR